jgi:beta-fructofuranosidase
MFCCLPGQLDERRRADWRGGGVWVAPGESLLGPWDLERAAPLAHPSLYAANFVQDGRDWAVLGFRDSEGGAFVGEITDPLPIQRHGGTVRLVNR